MSPTLLFVHGWGLSASMWDSVRRHLADLPSITVELGFRGRCIVPQCAGPIVGIGHSLGFAWLLKNRPAPLSALIGINAFASFTRQDHNEPGIDRRILARMRARCALQPEMVVSEFLARSGQPGLRDERLNTERLLEGLDWLRDWDLRADAAQEGRIFILAAENDAIVTPAKITSDFQGRRVDWSPTGSHLLPLLEPEWCAERIRQFIAGMV